MKTPHSRYRTFEETSTFLELHSGFVNLLSQSDRRLLIGILEGRMPASSDFDAFYTFFDGMFGLAGLNNELFTKNPSKSVLSDQMADVPPPSQTSDRP